MGIGCGQDTAMLQIHRPAPLKPEPPTLVMAGTDHRGSVSYVGPLRLYTPASFASLASGIERIYPRYLNACSKQDAQVQASQRGEELER